MMAAPRVCVLRAPGTNCDVETAYAFEICGGRPERIHLQRLIEQPSLLDDFQVLAIPGGFSYGDDVGSGVIFASQLRQRLGDAVGRFLQSDKLVLGICNGFQTLLKAGVLPQGSAAWGQPQTAATLTWNHNGKYTARWIRLEVRTQKSVFLRGIRQLDLPMAHAEGRLVVRDPAVLDGWTQHDQRAMVYVPWQRAMGRGQHGQLELDNARWPANPNGSVENLAGLCDPTGRVLGLMPHPERFLFPTQHPNWTRRPATEQGEGRQIFQNAMAYFG